MPAIYTPLVTCIQPAHCWTPVMQSVDGEIAVEKIDLKRQARETGEVTKYSEQFLALGNERGMIKNNSFITMAKIHGGDTIVGLYTAIGL